MKNFHLFPIYISLIFLIVFILFFASSYSSKKNNLVYAQNSNIMALPSVEVGFWLQSGDHDYYADLPKFGGKVTSITVSWNSTERSKGNFGWNSLNNYVNGILKIAPNTRILLHIFSKSSWATNPPSADFPDAEMPVNNIEDWNDYIRALVKEFKGRISVYSLSNEAAAPQNWAGGTDPDFSKYATQLKSLYTIVKEVDPNAYVTNDGTASGTNLFAYGYRALYLNEPSPHQNAINYFNNSMVHHVPTGFAYPMTEEAIEKRHGGYMDKFWGMLLANRDYIDFVNLHWYQTTDRLPETLDWIQTQFPGKPLQLWETAFAWDQKGGQTYQGYDLTEQAEETFKLMTIGAAYGGWTQLWPWTSRQEDLNHFPVGVVDLSAAPVPSYRPAAKSFKVVTDHLNYAQFKSKVNLGNKVTAFKFIKGDKEIYAIWSQSPTVISLPLNSVSMIDVTGVTTNPSSNAIPISQSPVFIEGVSDSFGECQQKSQGDANCDGHVDGVDYSLWLNSQCHPMGYGKCANLQADFNSDGNVDDEDYNIWFEGRNILPDITTIPTPVSSNPFPAQKKVDTSNLIAYQVWLNYYPKNDAVGQTSLSAFENAASHLKELADMGVTMIQLSMFYSFDNKSASMTTIGAPSSILDFYEVNPGYTGPTPTFILSPTFPVPTLNPGKPDKNSDALKSYIQQAHSLGLKVIMDCGFHTTSPHHPFVSIHPEYYRRDKDGKLIYLPSGLDKNNNRTYYYQVELDFNNPDVTKYLVDMTKYWVNTVDIDGCRSDVAAAENIELLYEKKRQSFWALLNNEVKKIKPSWFQIAEITVDINKYGGPFSGPGYNPGETYTNVYSFDALYGVKYMMALRGIINTSTPKGAPIPASVLQTAWAVPDMDPNNKNVTPIPGMIFYRSEDNGDQYPRAEKLEGGNSGMLAGMAVNFTLDGIPFIWNGQEIGDETPVSVAVQKFISWTNPPHPENRSIFKQLIGIRKSHPALMKGTTTWYTTDNPDNVISYLRQDGNDKVLVVVNFSANTWTGTVTGTQDHPLTGSLTDLVTGKPVPGQTANNQVQLTLGAYNYLIASLQ